MPNVAPGDLHGIHAILYALFDRDEELDHKAMRRQTRLCLAQGIHCLAALGLATEASKLSETERCDVMEWLVDDAQHQVPVAITIYGSSVEEQSRQVRHAELLGIDWMILRPPMIGSYSAIEYMRFFGKVADKTSLPVAIQNSPALMGRGLIASDSRELCERHPNIQLIKGGLVVDIAHLIEITDGKLPIFNGRAGLELPDNLRVGRRGLSLAPDCVDYAVQADDAFRNGAEDVSERVYQRMLSALVNIMQGIEHLICYGKRLFGARAGLEINDRAPALRPTSAGLR